MARPRPMSSRPASRPPSPLRPLALALGATITLTACTPLGGPTPPPSLPAGGDQGALSGLGGAVLLKARVGGVVLGADGQPAAGVAVDARPLESAGYGLQAADEALATRTDAAGRFAFELPAGTSYSVEAVAGPQSKAIRQHLQASDGEVRLQLGATGTLSGRVAAPDQPGVTDFEGVDVFVPGTSYVAKADRAGRFTLADLPASDYVVVASKPGLGRGSVAAVRVAPGGTVDAGAIALAARAPLVTAVAPAVAAPGMAIEIRGAGFGSATGTPATVSIGEGLQAEARRVDDGLIRLTLPPTARSGNVVVTLEGRPSAPVPLTVIERLLPLPGRDALLLGEASELRVHGVDARGSVMPDLPATWSGGGGAVALAGATARATGEGADTLQAAFGGLTASIRVPVRALVGEASLVYRHPATTSLGTALDGLVRDARTGRLYALDHAGDVGGVLALDDAGHATAVAGAPSGAPAPTSLALGADGTLYVLRADNSVWAIAAGQAARRVLDPATLKVPALQGPGAPPQGPGMLPPGSGSAPLAPGGAPLAGGPPGPRPGAGFGPPDTTGFQARGLVALTDGTLAFQWLPGLAVRFAPDSAPVTTAFAPPAMAGQAPPRHQLTARGDTLVGLLERPGLTPALVTTVGTPGVVSLAREIGTPSALAADGHGRVYVASADRHAIFEIGPSGDTRLLLAPLGATPDAARGDLEAPRALLADEAGETLWIVDGANGERVRRIAVRRARP